MSEAGDARVVSSVEGERFLSVKRSADLVGGSTQCLRMTTTSYARLAHKLLA